MKIRIIALLVMAPIGAQATQPTTPVTSVGSGHITAAGPWTTTRSITVLMHQEGIDGFFFDARTLWGACVTTAVTKHSGVDYNLSFNFHELDGSFIAGCTTSARDEKCVVPSGANTGEVTGVRGVDLDVDVSLIETPAPRECRIPTKSG